MLTINQKAPYFALPDQDGNLIKLDDLKGERFILYFYAKDMTAGCSKQACAFGELYPQFKEKGVKVFGVSADSVSRHKKFAEKYNLPFTLLSDETKEIHKAYDVLGEKNMYGKKVIGTIRTTYLIDEEGVIIKAFGKVKPDDNASQMLNEIND